MNTFVRLILALAGALVLAGLAAAERRAGDECFIGKSTIADRE
jgi:hypothetical protein